jgi:hypothetical protein
MRVPYGLTEAQVMKTIKRVINILSPSFVFGYFTLEDIKQEAFMIAMDGLERYDGRKNSRKVKCREERLMRFLSVHVRNRLFNFKRKHYFRYEKSKDESQYENLEKLAEFRRRLMHPWDVDDVPDEDLGDGTDFEREYDERDYVENIERQMTDGIRNDFRRMLAGVFITDERKAAVQKIVAEIIDAEKKED